MRELPKLYSPRKIKFWSLRNGVGANMGAYCDCDTLVERTVVRVACPGGWKWQIKNLGKLYKWDWCAVQDQEILDEYGSELEFEYV